MAFTILLFIVNFCYFSKAYHHGNDGPMVIEDSRHFTKIRGLFLEAGKSLGYDVNNPNGFSQMGFSPYLYTINNGWRWTPADAYLHPKKNNLHVALQSHVHKVLFDRNNRAVGVKVNRRGRAFNVFGKKEVILSGGVIGSPQILMLSGIGPAQHLLDKNIYVRHPSPGVGQNLQDHVAAYGLTWILQTSGIAYNAFYYAANPWTYWNWKTKRTGPLAAPIGVEGVAFLPTKFGIHSWPDVQLTVTSTHAGSDGGSVFKNFLLMSDEMFNSYFKENSFKEGYSIYPSLSRPFSRGNITLKSSNPYDHPLIQPNYLSDERDVDTLVEGIKLAIQIGNSPSFKKFGSSLHAKPLPSCQNHKWFTDDYWRCYVKTLATSDHHPVGTCKMGSTSDPNAVVDPRFNVYGVKGLRVIDASVIPTLPSGNINIPVIMMAERGADFIKQNYLGKLQ